MNTYFVTKYVADKRCDLILKFLKKFDKKNLKILDVGCGNRYVADKIKNKGYNVVGIDKCSPEVMGWIKKKPDCIMDATNMGFQSSSYDVIIALEVMEHCDCISEINRVLKPSGRFYCSTPTPGTDWIRTILVKLRLLHAQDFEHHDYLIDLRKVPMKLIYYKKMFLGTSQFGVFTKKKR